MAVPKLSRYQLDLVSNNLQNIYLAAHDTSQSIELVPALIGKRLFYSKAGWHGRVLCFIHSCISFVTGNDSFVKKKLNKSILATQKYFNKLEHFRKNYHDIVFQDYIQNSFKELPSKFSKKEIQSARKEIRAFYHATYPFTYLVKTKTNDKLNQFLGAHFKKYIDAGKRPFYSKTRFKNLKDFVNIMSLEGYAQGELSLNLFRKMGEQNRNGEEYKLNKEEKKSLQFFVEGMHTAKKKEVFKVASFHKGMKSIVRQLKHSDPQKNYDLKQLEISLIENNCILLQESDQQHLEWRQSLRKGEQLLSADVPFYFLNDRNEKFLFEVGDDLKGSKKHIDSYKVYDIYEQDTLKKYQDFLMVIGPNKICLEYKDRMRFISYWGLETPTIQYIHPKGKYAIVERLFDSVENIHWKSPLTGKLDEEDLKHAGSLQVLIQFFIDEKNTPENFRAEYLKFDGSGKLKSTKDFIPCGFVDYICLEEICFKIAHESNLPIYQHLIKPMRDDTHGKKLLKFFRKVIYNSLEKRLISIERLAKKHRIFDEKAISRARELRRITGHLKKECEEVIFHRYHELEKEGLQTLINKSIIASYEREKTFGRFWRGNQSDELVAEIEMQLK